jgi:hypothetical protein
MQQGMIGICVIPGTMDVLVNRFRKRMAMADISKDSEVLEFPIHDAGHVILARDEKTQTVRFLDVNPFLYEVLGQVAEHVQAYFNDAPLMLELVTDAEDARGEQLLLTIDTPLSAGDAIRQFEKFREDWWLDNLEQADSKLSIALNYPDV